MMQIRGGKKFSAFLACWLLAAACRPDTAPADPLSGFPKTPVTIESATGSHAIRAWLASTPQQRSQGLMFVRSIAPDTGMLFVYAPEHYVSMWMKNTYLPLDMLFIDKAGRVVNIVEHAQPESLDIINSAAPVIAVLELAAGTAKRLSLKPGDKVRSPAIPL